MLLLNNYNLKISIKCTYIILILSFALHQYFSFLIPFRGVDTTLYSLIGKSIFEGQNFNIIPFEHKPLGASLIYGFFGELIKYGHGQSQIIAIFFNLIFLVLGILFINLNKLDKQKKITNKIFTLFVCLIVFHAPFVKFQGNTESIINVFIGFSIICLFIGTEKKNSVICILLSGILAVFSLNINFLSGPILFFPSIYLILKSKIIKKYVVFFYYSFGILIGCLIIYFFF